MLDNIKMLLGIAPTDTSKDTLINYWINYYTKMVLKYCHISALNEDLQGIVEQMVILRMGGLGSASGTGQQPIPEGVKSITRGDYSITYKDTTSEKKSTSSQLDKIAIDFQGQLNLWRRLDY